MKVVFINNDGGGFADTIDVRKGTTIRELFAEKIGDSKSAADYLIRVNRQPCTGDQVLNENDRVSMTPTKIEGASSHR